MVVNHGESCCASRLESSSAMLSQSFGNHELNAVPVGVNLGELC
jgi:hypothetical protein